MKEECCLITTACDNEENAEEIRNSLLEKRLASCVQFIKINSSYYWDGGIQNSNEILLQIKSKKKLYKEIEKEILELHNYEVPEIAMYDLIDGYSEFLKWINKETK